MKIAIDVREFKKGTYTGIRNILENFFSQADMTGENEFILFGNQYTETAFLPKDCKKVIIPESNTFLWDQFKFPAALRKEKVDVFFSPYIKAPLWRACPYVNLICDVIPLSISKFKGAKAALDKIHFFIYAFFCSHRALKVITLSSDSKNKVSGIFGIKQDKLEIVYPSVELPVLPDSEAKKTIEKYGLDKPYLLYTGNFKPHKNLENLIKAFDLLPEELKNGYRLFLIGGSDREAASLEQAVKERGLSGKVVPISMVDRDEVFVFLKNASAFVFPSLAEGFGIPPVEAMAAGIPVASSDLAPMREVLGDAALFFDPYNPEDISRAILKLIREKDAREQCISRGHERALMFRAKDMSQKILDILENAGRRKTLCVSSDFPPVKGGISTQVFNLWSRLPGEEIVILTARSKKKDIHLDESLDLVRKTYPLGKDIFSRIIRTVMIAWYVWQESCIRNIKRIHCAQIISAGLAGLILKRIKGTPYVVYAYSADVLEFSKNFLSLWLMKRVCAESEHIIANSVFTKSTIKGNNLANEDKISVSTPGVDTSFFNPEKGADKIREKYGLPDRSKMLLTVSRLAARKGHENIIKILPGILKKHPETVYVIVGEGKERFNLKELVKEKGLEKNVLFAGKVPEEELTFFYNTCDAFVMAPRYIKKAGDIEGFGIVFLEANACGKPVVAGKSGGIAEAVIDGQTGLLVDPEKPDEIRDAVLRLLDDEEYARKLGEGGLLRVKNEFNWETRAEELRKYI
ncbi:MAG: glycosyltransferase [Candidatus Omnitrophota bacterium]